MRTTEDLINDFGFGITWDGIRMYCCEGEKIRMNHYHMHSYYEISLLLTGNISVFLSDKYADRGRDARAVMLKPFTVHYMVPQRGVYYRHCNIEFSQKLAAEAFAGFPELASLFQSGGNVIYVDDDTSVKLMAIADRISAETDYTHQKLLLLQFLSLLMGKSGESYKKADVPEYITKALRYIGSNYAKKENAQTIAEEVGVSRTTLMTNFKKYTGVTVNEYIIRCRINHAIPKLNMRESEENIAVLCGFGSVSNMIHSFKKVYGMTPQKYIRSSAEKET